MTAVPAPAQRAPYPYLSFLPKYTPRLVDTATKNLLDLYGQAERDLNARWAKIVDEPTGARARARVTELLGSLARSRANVDVSVQEWLRTTYPGYYAGGASKMAGQYDSTPFRWAQPHRDAVGLLAVDTYSSLLRATEYTPADIKATVRELARTTAAETLLGGKTATQGGRSLAERLKTQGISTVTYANGAKVKASTYATMVVRTQTAIAYNAGGINQARADGVEWFEINDGLDCGLTYHDDGNAAGGQIVNGDVAQLYPISHANCTRSFFPRPDLTDGVKPEDVVSLVDPVNAADQLAFDTFIRQEQAANGSTIQQAAAKFGRQERTGRTPRTPRNEPTVPVAPIAVGPDPEAVALAHENIATATAIEPDVTAAMVDTARAAGGTMEGLDFRLKSESSLLRKLTEIVHDDHVDLPTASASIKDNLRYTTTFAGHEMAAGARAQLDALEAKGYRVIRTRNTFGEGNIYRGINMILETPDGYKFELQFHTPESFALKNAAVTHDVYASIKGLAVNDPARIAAETFMRDASANLAMPLHILDAIPDGYTTPVRPVGKNPSEILAYETKKAQTRYEPYARALDALHSFPDDLGPSVTVKVGSPTDRKGGHFAPNGKRPTVRRKPGEDYATFRLRRIGVVAESVGKAEIRINPNRNPEQDHSGIAFLHEFGHRTDYTYGPGGDYYHSSARGYLDQAEKDAWVRFLDAATNSPYFDDAKQQALRSGIDYRRYFTDPKEVWARAYSQWAAGKLGADFPELLVQLDRMRGGGHYYQWPDEAFGPVAAAIENVLRVRGLLR